MSPMHRWPDDTGSPLGEKVVPSRPAEDAKPEQWIPTSTPGYMRSSTTGAVKPEKPLPTSLVPDIALEPGWKSSLPPVAGWFMAGTKTKQVAGQWIAYWTGAEWAIGRGLIDRDYVRVIETKYQPQMVWLRRAHPDEIGDFYTPVAPELKHEAEADAVVSCRNPPCSGWRV